ncbi:MAG TPA: hypothetical protein VHW71_05150 [Steroidobacteraceae bacterium]|jgi:hypothetical protein|nr:hypothetical protein [Steroidobacteraceae bacterium]
MWSRANRTAGVPVSTVKLIVGHDRKDLTYGGYSPRREPAGADDGRLEGYL